MSENSDLWGDRVKVRLGDYIQEYSVRNRKEEDIPVYSVTNTEGFCTGYFDKDVASVDRSTYKIVPRGFFAYNPSRINVGSVDWQRCEDRVIVSPLYVVFSVSESLMPQYLYYYLKSDVARFNIRAAATGSVRDNLKFSMLQEFTIKMRSLKEQNIVVQTLDAMQRLIKLYQRQLLNLDSLIKARFVEMFGNPEANPMKWDYIKLGEICDLQNGYAFKSDDYLDHSTVFNCRMSNIRPDGGFDADYHPKFLPEEYWDTYQSYRLVDGDVIIAMTDMASDPKILGVPTIVKSNGHKFLLNQRVGKLLFRDASRMNNTYVMFFLGQAYIRKSLAKSAGGSTQINVGKPAILNITILEPPRFLQDQFAAFVSQVDKSKSIIQAALTKDQLLFDSLMQKYFG